MFPERQKPSTFYWEPWYDYLEEDYSVNQEQVHTPENECPDVFNFSFRYTLSEILVANTEETSSYLSSGYSKA